MADDKDIRTLRVAFAGNPNVGKTTLFNSVTGMNQQVGNWSGVTVEKVQGRRSHKGVKLEIIDLPGTYSLTAQSRDEVVARDHIIDDRPDVVVQVLDASNLERNMYLTTQLKELEVRLVLALNMVDVVEGKGDHVHLRKLEEYMEEPVVRCVASKSEGIDDLLDAILAEGMKGDHHEHSIGYGDDLESIISPLTGSIAAISSLSHIPSRWLAIKLLEGDETIIKRVMDEGNEEGRAVVSLAASARNPEMEISFIDKRYEAIHTIVSQVYHRAEHTGLTPNDRLDMVLTHRVWGIPIFLGIIWLVFQLTFTLATPFMDVIDGIFAGTGGWVRSNVHPDWFASLISDGIIGSVGFVLVFLPNIFILFFLLAFLEGSGYMARASFLMDRVMYRVGLNGRSFIPLILGFGCSVPAVMSTRTIPEERDRILTILVTPFITCSARLPVYVLLAGVFFSHMAGTVIFGFYVLSILVAITSAKILGSTILPGKPTPFVMELPPYRLPTMRNCTLQMWEKGKHYLHKAGTIIFVAAIGMWLLTNMNWDGYIEETSIDIDDDMIIGEGRVTGVGEFSGEGVFTGYVTGTDDIPGISNGSMVENVTVPVDHVLIGNGTMTGPGIIFQGNGTYVGPSFTAHVSFAADIGRTFEPLTRPLGFDWRMNTALVFGVVAKEIVVGSLGVLYGVGEEQGALTDSISNDPAFSPAVGLSLMVFVLSYIPCVATVGVILKETGSWRWTGFQVAYGLLVAWVLSFIVYNVALLGGLG